MRLVRGKDGFTLVELLIVVIILAILASIVVPQFTATTDDAREAALETTLGNMRSALDLYYQQHGEYPSALGDGTNAANDPLAFLWQLARYTTSDGDAQLTSDPAHEMRSDRAPGAMFVDPDQHTVRENGASSSA